MSEANTNHKWLARLLVWFARVAWSKKIFDVEVFDYRSYTRVDEGCL
jgi:hypothetical protein